MLKVTVGIAALSWSGFAIAQGADPATPALLGFVNGIKDAAHTRDLSLKRLSISVAERGVVAETTVEASFLNATTETLEGDFRFRLPPGAVVTGYALDVNGQIIDGVLVDRPRAKAVYDARVRVRVDPGIAEVAPDNLFHAQVNPILPGRTRTIRLRFAMPVSPAGYRLPIAVAAPVDGWRVAVTASGTQAAPSLQLPGGARIVLGRTATGYDGAIERTRAALAGEIAINAPEPAAVVVSEHRSGERDVQLGGQLAAGRPSAVGSLRLYWDRSRARLEGNPAAEVALARRLIEQLRPTSIELVAFNSSGATRATVKDAAAAAAWLAAVRYRGATSFAPIAHDAAADRCLLFAQGGPTIDRGVEFHVACRLDAISSAAQADRGWLRHAAGSTGGGAYALAGDNGGDIVRRLAAPAAGVVAITDQDGRALPFIALDAPAGRWLALAKAPEGGPVTVRLVENGVERRQVMPLDGGAALFDATGALIAADELAPLGATEQRDAFVALSRRYGIASPSLSFLVLENAADYLAADIVPPLGYPADERDNYLRARKASEADRTIKAAAWIDRVADEWAQTVAWWSRKFDPAARPRRVATSRSFDRTAPPIVSAPVLMAPPAPPAPPASPAPPPPPTMSPTDAADVMVTGTRAEALHRTGGIGAPAAAISAIHIDAWAPDRPYLELYDGRPADFDERFLEAEKRHGSLPIFYLDTAEWLGRHGRADEATEMVLSALTLPTANEVTLGIVADRLERYGAIDRAVELRERQATLDPDRPQPRRLLALALARRAALRPATARADLTRAVVLLYAVATTPHDPAWNGIETVALVEANALLPKLRRLGGTAAFDPRLVRLLDVDTRVVIDWTTDGSDMDLWVDEPSGERAIYNNQRTAIGGHLSTDMTRGYGPEEYMLHVAPRGTYLVQANVFAPDRLDPNGATLLTAHLFHDFGRATQREEAVDVEVTRDDKGAKQIGRIIVAARTARTR